MNTSLAREFYSRGSSVRSQKLSTPRDRVLPIAERLFANKLQWGPFPYEVVEIQSEIRLLADYYFVIVIYLHHPD